MGPLAVSKPNDTPRGLVSADYNCGYLPNTVTRLGRAWTKLLAVSGDQNYLGNGGGANGWNRGRRRQPMGGGSRLENISMQVKKTKRLKVFIM